MTRKLFEEQIAQLKDLLVKMGQLNTEAIADAVTALETQDVELAKKTKAVESKVDEKEQEIERLCLKLILKQQPVASDLLFVTSAMKMITDMERIADQAVDISELVIKMSRLPYAESLAEIPQMADRVQAMVHNATKSFVDRDGELVGVDAVAAADEKVSSLMKKMQAERVHMIIVGGQGNAEGLITREDIIEELLGDVDDKYDLTPVTSPLKPAMPEESADEEEE